MSVHVYYRVPTRVLWSIRLMFMGSLFILDFISGILINVFNCVLLVIKPQQCKLYSSVMKSIPLNVQNSRIMTLFQFNP